MENLKKQLDELKNKVNELEKAIEEKENENWSPKMGETYFYINNEKNIMEYDWENDDIDNIALRKRNVYKTREEAKLALDMYEFCRERSFRPDWKNENEVRCIIGLDHRLKEKVVINFDGNYFAPFYYSTYKKAQEVVGNYSFDELAKYYGRV